MYRHNRPPQRGECPIQRGTNTIRSQMVEAEARVTRKPYSCRRLNQHANTKSKLATEPMTMDPTKSAVCRWSPRLAENTIHIARGAVRGIVEMIAARWRERSRT